MGKFESSSSVFPNCLRAAVVLARKKWSHPNQNPTVVKWIGVKRPLHLGESFLVATEEKQTD